VNEMEGLEEERKGVKEEIRELKKKENYTRKEL